MSTATDVLPNDRLPGDPNNKPNRFVACPGPRESSGGESNATQEAAVEGKRARAQQQVWKSHEVELLQQGVARYGRNWKAILDDNDFAPTLGGRSAGSLKLKWYKMSKEHEEKMNANSRLWGHHQPIPPGQSISFMGIEGSLMGGLNNPFSKTFLDGYGGIGGSCEGMFEPFRPEEIQALKESTARYGPNWTAILSDPNYAVPLMNRSPAALQMFWNQLQEMPKPSLFDNGNHANSNQDDCNSEGLDGFSEGYQQNNQPLQSMRSWGRLETDALVKGFEIYGTDWKAILHDARYRPHLSHRTAHSLKSKWARMMKKRKREDNRQFSMQSPSPMSMGGFGNDPHHNAINNVLLSSSDCFTSNHAFNTGIPASLDEGGMKSSIQPAIDPSENYDRSIEEYTREIALNSSNPVLYNHRGVVYYAKGMIDQALDDFTTAIALDCSYADAFTNRGMAFNSKGEFDLAIMDCTTTIDINPTSHSAMNAYLTRALTHYNKGMYEQCIADCESTLALRPRCVSALVTRGLTIMAQAKEGSKTSAEMLRHYEMALKDFKEAMSIDPSNAQARVWYEEAVLRLSDPSLRTVSSGDDLSELLLPNFKGSSSDVSNLCNSDSASHRDTLASRFMH